MYSLRNVLTDILTFPALRKDLTLCLEDIDEHRLDLEYRYLKKYQEENPAELSDITIESTTDQKKAIADARYVISAIQVGRLEPYKIDIDIPLKYGVTQ